MRFQRIWCPLWSPWHCIHAMHRHACRQKAHGHKLKLKMFVEVVFVSFYFWNCCIISPFPLLPPNLPMQTRIPLLFQLIFCAEHGIQGPRQAFHWILSLSLYPTIWKPLFWEAGFSPGWSHESTGMFSCIQSQHCMDSVKSWLRLLSHETTSTLVVSVGQSWKEAAGVTSCHLTRGWGRWLEPWLEQVLNCAYCRLHAVPCFRYSSLHDTQNPDLKMMHVFGTSVKRETVNNAGQLLAGHKMMQSLHKIIWKHV